MELLKWSSLTRNQQAYIATVAAGSRQQSRFLALMNNYDRTLDLIVESQNSAGAAAQQYAIYQDSVAAAQARLTASWEKFYSKIVDNSLIKTAINGMANLVDTLSNIPPIITAIGASLGALQLQNLFKVITNSDSGVLSLATNFKVLYQASKSTDIKWEALLKTSPKLVDIFKGLKTSTDGIINSFVAAAKASAAFVVANKWWFIAGTALIITIGFVTKALNTQKDAYDKNIKAIQKLQEKTEEYRDKAKSGKELIENYKELSTNINRTAEEQIELNNIIKEIAKLYPDAITYMDEYGNMHLRNSDKIEKEIEKTEKLYEDQKKLAIEARKPLITGNIKYATEEDFNNIGYNSEATQRYFYYKDLLDKSYDTSIGLDTFFNGQLALNDAKNAKNRIGNETHRLTGAINDINKAIDAFGLSLKKLDTNSNWEKVFDKADEIEKARDKLKSEMGFYKEQLDQAKADMEKETDIELAFLDLKFSDKQSTAVSQKAIAADLQNYFSSMGSEVYNAFNESLKDKKITLTDFIQEALDKITDVNKGIEAKNLIEKILNPDNFDEDLSADFNHLGQLCGASFRDGLRQIQQNAINILWDKTLESFTETFGEEATEKYKNNDQKTLQNMVEVGNEWKNTNGEKLTADQAIELAQAYEQIKKLQAQKITEGTVAGWEEGVERIKNNTGLEGIVLDVFEKETSAMGDILKEDVMNKSFDEAQTRIQDFFASYKESIDDLISGVNDKAIDKGLTSSDDNVFLNPETGELIVSITQSLAEKEKERLNLVRELSKEYEDVTTELKSLQDPAKKLTTEEEKRKKQLENQLEILNQEAIILDSIAAKTEISGWGKSLQLAEDYKDKITMINDLQENLKEQSFLDISDMKQVLNLMPEYASQFEEVQNGIYTISEKTIEAMKESAKSKYEYELALERQQAEEQYLAAKAEYDSLVEWAAQIGIVEDEKTKKAIENQEKEVLASKKKDDDIVNLAGGASEATGKIAADNANNLVTIIRQALEEIGHNIQEFIDSEGKIHWDQVFSGIQSVIDKDQFKLQVGVEFNKDNFLSLTDDYESLVKSAMSAAQARMDAAFARLQTLQKIDVPELEKLKKSLDNTSKASDKTGKDLEKLAKIVEDAADSIEKLDNAYLEFVHDLNAIKLDYNPFTELFEAWEHEWDYYYNIKRLIAELGQQGQFIDNIVSADFASADQKVAGYHAKIGNLIAQMSANDTYITSLRTGMSQTAIELMKDYGEYYKINPDTGQIYQTDKSLNEINTTINAAKEELYELSKVQNTRQNDLNLENSKLEALEQEKSAYESILSEVESQIDSYKNLDDVITDTSELEANRSAIKAKIEISDESIEAQKEKIRNMEDEIQNLEIQIELKGNIESDLEDYVEKMGDKVQEYEEYWETLNSTIAEQQEILSQLNDVFSYYVDTAISTQQDLYNAIVENYQDEINKKKEQYDYLKQLDKDYLASVKDNIDQERKAREESNKQKSYQQSLQRMQLLQQDTSGAYRNEIAQLGKEIEDKRQELYDDLVDKQVEALEKEVEKRHELYDKEVAALEERLAYMQENAILLWEMVNNIVAEGAESMMVELENTTAYINSNELSRQKQRKQWEQNIKITYDGVTNNQIDNIKAMVEKGKDYINSLQEIKSSMEVNIETYKTSTQILIEENEQFQNAMNTFMIEWNRITNRFTGYYESWEQTVSILKTALDNNIQALIAMNNEGGSIKELDRSLRNSAKDMYDDFIAERQRYRNELEGLIQQIKSEISAAIQTAADTIRNAASSLQNNPNGSKDSNNFSGGNFNGQNSGENNFNGGNIEEKKYRLRVWDQNGQAHYSSYGTKSEVQAWYQKAVMNPNLINAIPGINLIYKLWRGSEIISFLKGGLANFTGPAWLDGTSSNPERILSPRQTKLFESMVHSLEKSTNSNINSGLGSSYNIGDINTTIQVDKLDNEADVNKLVKQVEDKILKTIRNRVVVSV